MCQYICTYVSRSYVRTYLYACVYIYILIHMNIYIYIHIHVRSYECLQKKKGGSQIAASRKKMNNLPAFQKHLRWSPSFPERIVEVELLQPTWTDLPMGLTTCSFVYSISNHRAFCIACHTPGSSSVVHLAQHGTLKVETRHLTVLTIFDLALPELKPMAAKVTQVRVNSQVVWLSMEAVSFRWSSVWQLVALDNSKSYRLRAGVASGVLISRPVVSWFKWCREQAEPCLFDKNSEKKNSRMAPSQLHGMHTYYSVLEDSILLQVRSAACRISNVDLCVVACSTM